jgi:hypothetical protein
MSSPASAGQPLLIPAAPPLPPRHALGLPAGSIRAILALLVVGLFSALVLLQAKDPTKLVPIPAYLLYLLFLILGHFFAAHGHTIQQRGPAGPSPLYLPAGSIRFLLLVALVGTVVWEYVNDSDTLLNQLKASVEGLQRQPYLPLVLLGGFFIGVVVRALVGRHTQAYWWQDTEAWFALIATLGLCIEVIIRLVINPSLQSPLELPNWEGLLAGIVAFYFGARS